MSDQKKFQFSADEVKKLNGLLPRGYRFVTQEEFKKKAMLKPKKKTIMGLPVTPEIVTEINIRNVNQSIAQKPPSAVSVIPTTSLVGRPIKKVANIPSYEILP